MKIGLVVNPIAGMGGRVGLKGTDGVLEEALLRGAKPVAPGRATEFLESLASIMSSMSKKKITVVTCSGPMGAEVSKQVGIEHDILAYEVGDETDADDTKKCVAALYKSGVRLLVFVGGDGTARDILDTINEGELVDLLVLGVPSGVKMYSGIFVVNPKDAAEVIRLAAEGNAPTAEFEIMDADETAIREDRFIIKLHGYMKGPLVPARFQGAKQASPETVNEQDAQEAIARYVIDSMVEDGVYILGPGTTVRTVTQLLGVKKTTLGVDLYSRSGIKNDVNESEILEFVKDFDSTWIVVSPIGRQGILFGRGNQQISPKIIEKVGRDKILILSTAAKLRDIEDETLKVDTGNSSVDEMLRGYIRVITDYNELRLVKVE